LSERPKLHRGDILVEVSQPQTKWFPWLTDDKTIDNTTNVIELLEAFDDAAHTASAQAWLLLDETKLLIELGRKTLILALGVLTM
jgi:hypothetical protein